MPCAKGMRGCRADCLHRQNVQAYRDSRHAWEQGRESGAPVSGLRVAGLAGAQIGAFQLSDVEYAAAYPPPTFRDWLEAQAGERAWTEQAAG